jgi:hypothetical protein
MRGEEKRERFQIQPDGQRDENRLVERGKQKRGKGKREKERESHAVWAGEVLEEKLGPMRERQTDRSLPQDY